jgi:hypothetical protein
MVRGLFGHCKASVNAQSFWIREVQIGAWTGFVLGIVSRWALCRVSDQ